MCSDSKITRKKKQRINIDSLIKKNQNFNNGKHSSDPDPLGKIFSVLKLQNQTINKSLVLIIEIYGKSFRKESEKRRER